MLMKDHCLLEKLLHFNRERIPEHVLSLSNLPGL